MIIVESDSKAGFAALNLASVPSDPPPNYLAARQLLHSRSQSSLSLSDAANKPLPRIPPPPSRSTSNHLEVIRSQSTLKGSWDIDTSLPHTPARSSSDPASPSSSLKPNLRLVSRSGGIDAAIVLHGSNRATVEATSHDGPVTLRIMSQFGTPILLQIEARCGDVQVYLPHSFFGPVRCKRRRDENSSGNLHDTGRPPSFSSAMRAHLVALSSEEDPDITAETVSFFVGDLSQHDHTAGDEQWNADEVIIALDYKAQAYFFWVEETPETPYPMVSLVDSMVSRLKPWHGVIRPWIPKGRRRESDHED